MICDSPLDLVFRDLFFRVRGFAAGHDVFLKLEGFNISGSIKVKTAIGLVTDLERRGLATPGRTVIVESSSGNLGVALSLVCATRGYRFICVTDPNATETNLRGMRAYGAEVIRVTEPDRNGGFLATRLARIQTILAAEPDAIWLDQYANPANTEVHAQETAAEILAAFPKVDWLFVGTGTTGTFTGVQKGFRTNSPATRLVAVEPAGSVTFGAAPAPRAIPGIGTSRRPPLSHTAEPDHIVYIDEPTTVAMCRAFVRDHHLLVGGSTGTVLAAVQAMAGHFLPGETIVAISPDMGDKYLETVYDESWVRQRIGYAPNRTELERMP